MIAWTSSPVYGQSVVLGPVQANTYAVVMSLTRSGRRPYVTLGTIAERVGKPVSSVHNALGRLRALGLIGFAARMGRTGGHRLWRVALRSARGIDAARHRRAVARILRAFAIPSDRPAGTRDDPGGPPVHPQPGGPPSPFGEALRRHGFRPWWEDRGDVDTEDDRGSAANRTNRGDDVLGLAVATR